MMVIPLLTELVTDGCSRQSQPFPPMLDLESTIGSTCDGHIDKVVKLTSGFTSIFKVLTYSRKESSSLIASSKT